MSKAVYDCSVRTSVVADGGALVQLVPPLLAAGRTVRIRQVSIFNTTATAFGAGLGVATVAAVTPATAGTVRPRSNTGVADTAQALVWSTFATTPTAPTGYSARLIVPASGSVTWTFPDGDELVLLPAAATQLPFCVFSIGVGQVADVTLTWKE